MVTQLDAQLRGDDPRGKAHPSGKALAVGPHPSELAPVGGGRGEDQGRLVGGKGYGDRWRIPMSSCAQVGVRDSVDVEEDKRTRPAASLTVKGWLRRHDDGGAAAGGRGLDW
jgi:hypothetical protein